MHGRQNWQTHSSPRSVIKLLLMILVELERLCSPASFVEHIFRLKLSSIVVFFHSLREASQAEFYEQVMWAGSPMCTQQELFCSLHIGCPMQFVAQEKHEPEQ